MHVALSERLWFRVINDSLHDLSAGAGPGAVIGVWLARNGARATLDPAGFASLGRTWTPLLFVLFLALAILVVTGAVRLSYRTLGTAPDALAGKGRTALIKHALFVAVFIASTAVAFSLIQA